ncbi:hypothetical protein P3X46_010973 [Hevea brasiliensis]|uniref:Pectinesterase inhibitor domain-containing protein n=1 Tax=Hevea brasiliensis TaxID=3981 RepID=A0ABQ9MJU1_HEVBR|nr:uncharacterized protein LOC131180693 [Hevea brasiliensis]KAJ9179154.1 hypothetical protein P3X46_010973 [Hevea brasiliensis]
MELIINKSILIFLVFSSLLSFSTEATSRIPSKPTFSFFASDSPSPSPVEHSSNLVPFDLKPFLSAHFPNVPPSSIHSSLKHICGVTHNPAKCVSLIAPHMTGSVNVVSSLHVLIKTLDVLVKNASSIAMKVSKDPSTSFKVEKSLNISLEQYWKAISNIGKALAAFSVRDYDEVHTMLIAAITNFGFCDEAFYKQGLAKSPMKDINGFLIEFAAFGVDISTKLKENIIHF